MQLLNKTSLILRKNYRGIICVHTPSCKVPVILVDQIRLFSKDFRKIRNIKFHENTSRGSRIVPSVRTVMAKLTVAFVALRTHLRSMEPVTECSSTGPVRFQSNVSGKSGSHSLTPRFVSTARARTRYYCFEDGNGYIGLP
jgi:hypothetical protein